MFILEIVNKYWNGEPLKAIFNFTSPYEVSTEPNDNGDFIRGLDFHFINNNISVSPIGIVQSSTANLEIFTSDDALNPTNLSSEYYEDLVNGVRVDLYIDRDKNDDWQPYGVWYVSSWNGGYSEGVNHINSISLEDRLNSEFSVDMPRLEARGNAKIGKLIKEVFEEIGLDESEYIIDDDLDLSLTYAIGSGGKVRDFLNNICTLLLAKIRVDLEGIIHIENALNFNDYHNYVELSTDDLVSLSSTNTDNINYNKLILSYLSSQDFSRAVIVDDIIDNLTVGENEFNFTSNNLILSIEQVRLDVLNSKCLISDLITSGYQKEINLKIIVEGESSTYARVYIEGILASSKISYIEKEINTGTQRGGISYTLDLSQILSEEEAEEILLKLVDYVKIMSKKITLSGTILTSEIQPGDKVIISGANSYDGVYKVLNSDISYSSDYYHNLNLVRIEEV